MRSPRRCGMLAAGFAAVLLLPAGASTAVASGGGTDREGFVEVEGAKIFYQVEGQGQPLLLVHGYPLSGDLFAKNREELAEDYTVITLDLRGYGQSEIVGEQPEGSVRSYAQDVLAVMDELEVESAVIGGMSMGGPIVFSMYEQAPERFDGMILIDTVAAPAPPPEVGTWEGLAEVTRTQGKEAVPPLVIDEMLTGETRMEHPELADYLISIMEQASEEAYLAGANALATRPDFRPLLDDIDVPALVLVGLQDTIYPYSISQEMATAIPDAELVILDDASHAAILEQADEANEAIQEWAEAQSFEED